MYVNGKWVTDKFKPRRYTQDRMTNEKLKHRESQRRIKQEAEDFANTVMGWVSC